MGTIKGRIFKNLLNSFPHYAKTRAQKQVMIDELADKFGK